MRVAGEKPDCGTASKVAARAGRPELCVRLPGSRNRSNFVGMSIMTARYAIFWLASAVAALLTLWVAWDFLVGFGQRFPVINIPGLVLAAAIWLVGWLFRFAL
jgi:hypothetical protein